MSANLIWKKGPWHGDIAFGIVEHYTGTARNDGTQWHVLMESEWRTLGYQVCNSDADGFPGSTIIGTWRSLADAMVTAEHHEAARVATNRRKAALRAARAYFWNSYRYGAA